MLCSFSRNDIYSRSFELNNELLHIICCLVLCMCAHVVPCISPICVCTIQSNGWFGLCVWVRRFVARSYTKFRDIWCWKYIKAGLTYEKTGSHAIIHLQKTANALTEQTNDKDENSRSRCRRHSIVVQPFHR